LVVGVRTFGYQINHPEECMSREDPPLTCFDAFRTHWLESADEETSIINEMVVCVTD